MSPYTSPFFSNTTGYEPEINLLDDLVIEQIAMFGIDIFYMPRDLVNFDTLLQEGSKSAFSLALPIPMYLKTFSGYENGMEMLTKFGLQSAEEITLTMSKTQFVTHYAPFIKSFYQGLNANRPQPVIPPNPDYCYQKAVPLVEEAHPSVALNKMIGQTEYRPKEGDLIYFPFDDTVFEIKYVAFDDTFFQLGKGYTFDIQCEKFEYSGETFDTSIDKIDEIQDTDNYYKLEFDLKENGVGTFEFNESVKIYDYNLISGPQGIVGVVDDFNLDFFNSFSVPVKYVTAKVIKWNKPAGKLVVGDISNSDPTQMDPCTYEVNIDDLKTVIIVGDSSGAIYVSENAKVQEQIFDDSEAFQTEFDRIKIIDTPDELPFGFL